MAEFFVIIKVEKFSFFGQFYQQLALFQAHFIYDTLSFRRKRKIHAFHLFLRFIFVQKEIFFAQLYINHACFSRLYMEEEETCRLHCEKPFDMSW
jgi:hypothetical protein